MIEPIDRIINNSWAPHPSPSPQNITNRALIQKNKDLEAPPQIDATNRSPQGSAIAQDGPRSESSRSVI